MLSGKLDRRIVLQRSTKATDAFNQPIETFADWFTVWASYLPVSDGEKFRANETYSNLTARFQIRWSLDVSTLNTKDRVSFDGRIFDILGVKELNRREGLEITAAARAER